jgi:nucleotide-binding universal stress UspA family protein
MYKTILIAVDLTPASQPALREGLELSRILGARTVVLHVCEPAYEARHWFSTLAAAEAELYRKMARVERDEALLQLEARVAEARGGHREGAAPELRVIPGIPADAILDEAQRAGAELIVVGTHGRRGMSHALLGSIAERVVRTAPVPVLAVRTRET